MIKIYHNKQCSKSCAALDFLQQHSIDLEVQEYLEEVPSKAELIEILSQLGLKPLALIRKNEALFLEKFRHLQLTDEEWVEVMLQNPILIERPIVIKDGKAVIGRPLDSVIDLFTSRSF
ncbi:MULTISPECIES: arsenate reductase (glutaredoxin) [Sphingobacterium]|uniref:Arsenate reductase (Glutaredoxin) n=1 Tax=Sphingobacterium athyrii TaxID=2152717 RepID=A0A363NYF2_9SPHI|nr:MULTISPECIES: arsenate reductase (glutaredoxin) [Sphingobacterium]PUV25829.1 arsenate reductase (glutaredoxin) [Sphingobacterium athyrii]QIH33295.1 arsenate reductase (glutaredoxin) [Sphingobacterium sp. DR205]